MDIEYGCGKLYTPQSIGGTPVFSPVGNWQTNDLNFFTAYNWMQYFINVALTEFEWTNLPDGITPFAIETCLLYQGLGGIFRDELGKLVFAPATPVGRLSAYYEPERVRFILPNGNGSYERSNSSAYHVLDDGTTVYEDRSCVTLFDNMSRYPLMAFIDLAARRVAKCDRVVDVNVSAQMTPWVGRAGEMGRRDLYNKMMQITGNESVILESDLMMDDKSIEVLKTDAPFVADKVLDIQARIVNQLFTTLGIDNSFTNKKEREIISEVQANNEQIMLSRKSRMIQRERFCDEANALFGTNISVAWSVDHDNNGLVDMAADAHLGEVIVNED